MRRGLLEVSDRAGPDAAGAARARGPNAAGPLHRTFSSGTGRRFRSRSFCFYDPKMESTLASFRAWSNVRPRC